MQAVSVEWGEGGNLEGERRRKINHFARDTNRSSYQTTKRKKEEKRKQKGLQPLNVKGEGGIKNSYFTFHTEKLGL